MPPENRAGLIDDAFNLARGGQLTYDIALDMTKYLKNELDFIPWEATLTVFAYIRDMFSRNAGFGDLEVNTVTMLHSCSCILAAVYINVESILDL